MPIPVITQNPGIVWDYHVTLFYPRTTDVLPTNPAMNFGRMLNSAGWQQREDSYKSEYSLFTNNSAAGAYFLRSDAGGRPYMALSSAAAGRMMIGLDAMRAFVDIGTGFVLAAGAEHSSAARVFWLKWLMQSPDATPDLRCGLILQPSNNQANNRWPDEPLPALRQGGFGFCGDGAGQWRYASYDRAAASLLREAVALPAHTLSEWNMCELLIISERRGIPATVEIWFNGALIGNRNWGGLLLEPLTANEWCFLPCIAGGSTGAGGGTANFSDVECRWGRFTRTGIEV